MEIFVCSHERDDKIRYVCFQEDITDRQSDPDIIIREVLERMNFHIDESRCYAHSTSWRYERGRTMLTYLVWVPGWMPRTVDSRIVAPGMIQPPQAAGPLKPRPAMINEEHVLAHGLCHLRFLMDARCDAALIDSGFAQDVFSMLDQLPPAAAGRLG